MQRGVVIKPHYAASLIISGPWCSAWDLHKVLDCPCKRRHLEFLSSKEPQISRADYLCSDSRCDCNHDDTAMRLTNYSFLSQCIPFRATSALIEFGVFQNLMLVALE